MAEPDHPPHEIHPADEGVARKGRVFLSRSGQDRELCKSLIKDLQGLGYEVWAQDHGILTGEDFKRFMDKALRQCGSTIALLSNTYLKSDWCRDEALAAYRNGDHRLIPLLIEAGCRPDGLFAGISYVDAVALAKRPHELAQAVDQALREGKPLDQIPAFKALLHKSNFISNMTFDDAALLVGRDDAAKALETAFGDREAAVAITALAGMGGIGKSWLARVYATRHRPDYRGVWMIRAENESDLVQDLAALGAALHPEIGKIADRHAAARAALEAVAAETGQPFLLIYDNVETPDMLAKWRPARGAHVLATSRWADWVGTKATAISLDTLPAAAAVALLRELAPKTSEADAATIAEALGGLPLALTQAAAVLRRSRLTAAEYLADLNARIAKLPPASGDYPRTVRAAIEASVAQLNKVSPNALFILDLAAYLAPDDIPFELWSTAVAGERALPEPLKRPGAFKEAMGALETFSLARIDWDDPIAPTASVHRLVQAVFRAQLQEQGYADKVAVSAIMLLEAAYPLPAVANWTQCARLQPHVEAAIARIPDKDPPREIVDLIVKSARYLNSRANYSAALALLRRDLRILELALPPGDPSIANMLYELGKQLLSTGGFAEAEQVMRRAVAIITKAFGPNHYHLAPMLDHLGQVLDFVGKIDEAEAVLAKALKLEEGSPESKPGRIAQLCRQLAAVYARQQRLPDAEKSARRALAIDEKLYGPDAPATSGSLNVLARTLTIAGKPADAEPLGRRALRIIEQSYGADHPNTANALDALAQTLMAERKYPEAEALLRRGLAIVEAKVPAGHPTLAHYHHTLSLLFEATGRLNDARIHRIQALEILMAAYPDDDAQPEKVAVYHSLKALLDKINAANARKH